MSRASRWVAPAVGLLGLVDVISAVTRPERHRLDVLTDVVPIELVHAAGAVTATVGLLLVMLSRGLRRRKQLAWRATTLVIAASVGLHLAKGLDVEEAVLSLAILVLLIRTRTDFQAAGDPRSRWRAPVVGGSLLLADVVIGYVLVNATTGHVVAGDRSFVNTLRTAVRGLVGLNGPLDLQHGRGDGISDILLALGIFTAVTTVWLLLRAPREVEVISEADEVRLRALLDRHGSRDSLGYFALRSDKSVVFSPSGKAAIAFRVVGGCILASGDPLGDPEAWPGAMKVWLELAAAHAWVPAVVGCSEAAAEVWAREAGLDALELGDEAIVEVAEHTLEGRAMRGVRQAVARVERAGYSVQVRRVTDIPRDELDDLVAHAAGWRGGSTERGFSMALGRLGDPADDGCVVVTAEREGRLVAFLHFVPWGRDGLSLDLMRRDADCDNGINELLIVSALRAAPELGVARLSLNFAVFRSALDRGQRIGAGPVLRLWTAVLLFASKWWQIESLHRFNAKFRPTWEARFICYPTARDLPRVAVAYLEAEAFLVRPPWWPGQRRRLASAPPVTPAVAG